MPVSGGQHLVGMLLGSGGTIANRSKLCIQQVIRFNDICDLFDTTIEFYVYLRRDFGSFHLPIQVLFLGLRDSTEANDAVFLLFDGERGNAEMRQRNYANILRIYDFLDVIPQAPRGFLMVDFVCMALRYAVPQNKGVGYVVEGEELSRVIQPLGIIRHDDSDVPPVWNSVCASEYSVNFVLVNEVAIFV